MPPPPHQRADRAGANPSPETSSRQDLVDAARPRIERPAPPPPSRPRRAAPPRLPPQLSVSSDRSCENPRRMELLPLFFFASRSRSRRRKDVEASAPSSVRIVPPSLSSGARDSQTFSERRSMRCNLSVRSRMCRHPCRMLSPYLEATVNAVTVAVLARSSLPKSTDGLIFSPPPELAPPELA